MTQTKIIHRFWAGRGMPSAYVEYGVKWQELHPDWDIIDWGISDVLATLRPDLADIITDLYKRDAGRYGVELYVQMADVIGYWLVYRYGGVYVNCDIEPLKNIEEILPNKAWASYENHVDGRIVNAAIGAPLSGDPFWQKLLDGLNDNYFNNPTDEMVMSTGPGYLTEVAHKHPDQLHVFPVETFNSLHWSEVPDGGDSSWFEPPVEAYGVHRWGHKADRRSNHVETATPMPEEN